MSSTLGFDPGLYVNEGHSGLDSEDLLSEERSETTQGSGSEVYTKVQYPGSPHRSHRLTNGRSWSIGIVVVVLSVALRTTHL